jgi:tRNA(Ile)-lysidine synthase
VLRLGANFHLPVRIANVQPQSNDEASLRDARYGALVSIARDRSAAVIATAHHQEDQSETVLLALFRGAGPDGLAGMRARRTLADGIDLVRPLLRFSQAELRHACHVHALPYAVDPTNADRTLRRNAVRDALESLRPLFPGLDAAISRTAVVLSEERDASVRADLRRYVRDVLAAENDLRDVDFTHVEAAVRAMERGASGQFHIKPGVEMTIHRGVILQKDR